MFRRDRVGFVIQPFNLLPTLTTEQNMRLPLDLAGRRPDPEWRRYIVGVLGIAERMGHRPSQLSGGQQQRVACARALLSRPEVIFADEPTGNLDSRAGQEVLGILRRSTREFGQTIVMVTHDPMAAAYADRVVFLADGRLRGEETAPTRESVLDALKTTLAELRAHLRRLVLSAVAVVLGMAFVAGTFTATARSAFFNRFAAQARNADATVQPSTPRRTLPASTLATVRAVLGVAAVEGRIRGTAALLDRSGKVIASSAAIDVPADPRVRDLRVSQDAISSSRWAASEWAVDVALVPGLTGSQTVCFLDRHSGGFALPQPGGRVKASAVTA